MACVSRIDGRMDAWTNLDAAPIVLKIRTTTCPNSPNDTAAWLFKRIRAADSNGHVVLHAKGPSPVRERHDVWNAARGHYSANSPLE